VESLEEYDAMKSEEEEDRESAGLEVRQRLSDVWEANLLIKIFFCELDREREDRLLGGLNLS
jgi:hypothetical protein